MGSPDNHAAGLMNTAVWGHGEGWDKLSTPWHAAGGSAP